MGVTRPPKDASQTSPSRNEQWCGPSSVVAGAKSNLKAKRLTKLRDAAHCQTRPEIR